MRHVYRLLSYLLMLLALYSTGSVLINIGRDEIWFWILMAIGHAAIAIGISYRADEEDKRSGRS